MPGGLKRFYGAQHSHFITCSCYRRKPLLGTQERRDLFLKLVEETRQKYRFVVYGYVVMPEHFHWLVSEPEIGNPSTVMQVVKQRFAQALGTAVWQERFYDFNVWSGKKEAEKLRYMHRNPVTRGLVAEPDQWRWSSFRWYAYQEIGYVRVNFQEWPLQIRRAAQRECPALSHKTRKNGAPNS